MVILLGEFGGGTFAWNYFTSASGTGATVGIEILA
jgi:hypothetical protein